MRSCVVTMIALVLCGSFGAAAAGTPEYEMTTYRLAVLREPVTPKLDEAACSATSDAHRQRIARLIAEGKILVAGPVEGVEGVRGVGVLTVERDEAEALLADDPLVRDAGYEVDLYEWWAAKDLLSRGTDYAAKEPVWLGWLRRPATAPDLPEAELATIQEGHLANIRRMADEGYLVIAGPLADGGERRGILLFRDLDADRLRAEVDRDPAVQAGRLILDLWRWHVPAGTLPR